MPTPRASAGQAPGDLSVRHPSDAVNEGNKVVDLAAARLSVPSLEAEADAAYEEVNDLHFKAWEAHCCLARVERYRQDLEFAARHPIRAWFLWAAKKRIRQFERAALQEGAGDRSGEISSLDSVRKLEARVTAHARSIRGELHAAEARWERLHKRLADARTLASP